MFTFGTPILQTISAAAVLLLTWLAAWLAPRLIRFVFGTLLGVYQIYTPPPSAWEDDPVVAKAERLARYEYGHASRWRTDFWRAVEIGLVFFIVLTGLIIAYWMVHSDFLPIVYYGLGVGGVIALIGLSPFSTNFCAHLYSVCSGGPVRVSDYVEVAGAHGEVRHIGYLYTELRGYYPLTGVSAPYLVGASLRGRGAGAGAYSVQTLAQEARLEFLQPVIPDTSANDPTANSDDEEVAKTRGRVREIMARTQHVPNTWLLFQSIRVHPARLHDHPPAYHTQHNQPAPRRPFSTGYSRVGTSVPWDTSKTVMKRPHSHRPPPTHSAGSFDGPGVRGDYDEEEHETHPERDYATHVGAHMLVQQLQGDGSGFSS